MECKWHQSRTNFLLKKDKQGMFSLDSLSPLVAMVGSHEICSSLSPQSSDDYHNLSLVYMLEQARLLAKANSE